MSDQQVDSIASVTTVESATGPIEQLRAEMAHEMAQLRATIEQQQSELRELREQSGPRTASRAERRASARRRDTGRRANRRALLKWGGAAAAAAAVTAVASQGAHAAPQATGGPLLLGDTNAAENTTYLGYDTSAITTNYFTVYDTGTGVSNPSGWTGAIAGVVGSSPASLIYNGVVGYSNTKTGYGVVASADSNALYGLHAEAFGTTGSEAGVHAYAATGYGVLGISGSGVDLFAGGTGRFQQLLGGVGAPTTGSYSSGEQIRDANGDLWLCVGTGSPGTWVKVAHLAPGATAGGATTYLSKPVRLLDTRNIGDALFNGTGNPLTYNGTSPSYTLQIAGESYNTVDVPASAVGAIGNITVVATAAGGGYVALVPAGAGFQGTSNINYAANQIIANFFIVGLSALGAIDIYVGGNPTHVIIDLFAVVS